MKTHELIIINECHPPRGGTHFTKSIMSPCQSWGQVPRYGCQFPKDENKETEVSVGFRFFVSGLLK